MERRGLLPRRGRGRPCGKKGAPASEGERTPLYKKGGLLKWCGERTLPRKEGGAPAAVQGEDAPAEGRGRSRGGWRDARAVSRLRGRWFAGPPSPRRYGNRTFSACRPQSLSPITSQMRFQLPEKLTSEWRRRRPVRRPRAGGTQAPPLRPSQPRCPPGKGARRSRSGARGSRTRGRGPWNLPALTGCGGPRRGRGAGRGRAYPERGNGRPRPEWGPRAPRGGPSSPPRIPLRGRSPRRRSRSPAPPRPRPAPPPRRKLKPN